MLALAGASAAQAATDGSLGTTSTGTVQVSVSVPNRVQISGLADVAFTNQDPSVAELDAQDVCVWSNTGTRGYNIKATGNGASGAFTLASGGFTVPYSVQWAASSGASSGTALTAGTALTGLTSTAASSDCSSGPANTASLIVGITAPNLQSMRAATSYTGTLTLLVAPE
jgi:hypothetical protein